MPATGYYAVRVEAPLVSAARKGGHVRPIARWSAAIAVVVLSVLAAGVVGGGPAVAAAGPVTVAAGEQPHECHGAPLQDLEHAVAGPVRLADDAGPVATPGTLAVLCPNAVIAAAGAGAAPDRAPPAPGRITASDLQVFRI